LIFIDTGPLIARYHHHDQKHHEALYAWTVLEKSQDICVTSNLVLSEMLTLMGRRMGYKFAAERARSIYFSKKITIFRPSEEEEALAIDFMEKFADQQIGFVDCVSFVMMRKRKIQTAFSFDRHFTLAGFELFK
jgi:predicted nucleic acid-binding protein